MTNTPDQITTSEFENLPEITNADEHEAAVAVLSNLIVSDREEDTALMDAYARIIEEYELERFPLVATVEGLANQTIECAKKNEEVAAVRDSCHHRTRY